MGLIDSGAVGAETLASPTPDNTFASSMSKGITWDDILKAASQLHGSQQTAFGGLLQGAGTAANSAIPLYSQPLQAAPMQDEQQKQTSASDVSNYASIFASLFG